MTVETIAYRCQENEVLDAIVFKHYGTYDMLQAVLDANPNLADQGPLIEAGYIVVLPAIEGPTRESSVVLWD